jgi:DNA-binding IclR family transcriptional regulator
VQSVAKAARILRTFEPGRWTLTVRDIAARAELPRSTCHAICSTLVAEELLELLPTGGYRLGPGLLEMGGQVIERVGLVDAATPSMHSLSRLVDAEVQLGQLVSGSIVYLMRIKHERRLPADSRLGLRIPAHLTGCGRAALSQLPVQSIPDVVAPWVMAGAELDDLIEDLARARERGFAVGETLRDDVVSIAAPLRGPDGCALGALSLAQQHESLTSRRIDALGQLVAAAASDVTRRLRRRF